jgi:two-component system OmpR family response regulator
MGAATVVATKTVLVADDTAFVRERFRAALESAGHRVEGFRTGGDLLARLRQAGSHVDLVVVDLRLPQGRGLDLLRAIQQVPGPPPILVFSGTIGSAEEVKALTAIGVAGYINEYTAVQHIVPSLAPHLFPDQYNRRSSPRVVVGIPVAYRFGNTIAAAVTLNLSRGGLAIRTTSLLDVGTVVSVRFRVPSERKDITAQARVAWIDRRVGMGLQFTRLDTDDDTAIDAFVHSHFFSNRKA